jgi:hypothetical protein
MAAPVTDASSLTPGDYNFSYAVAIVGGLQQGLVKVPLSKIKIPLNLPLQRETFIQRRSFFSPFEKGGLKRDF